MKGKIIIHVTIHTSVFPAFVFVLAVNLREDPNQPFNPHPELGKYFKGFTGTRYIPNECLQQQYPEDVDEEEDV